MIEIADEFLYLRIENDKRARSDTADEQTWMDVINKYPDMKVWAVRNKTIQISILRFKHVSLR